MDNIQVFLTQLIFLETVDVTPLSNKVEFNGSPVMKVDSYLNGSFDKNALIEVINSATTPMSAVVSSDDSKLDANYH